MTKETGEAIGEILKNLAWAFAIVVIGLSMRGCIDRVTFNDNEPHVYRQPPNACELPDEVIESKEHTTTQTLTIQGKEN